MTGTVDPRTKLFIVCCLSSIGVAVTRIPVLISVLAVGLLFGRLFGVEFIRLIRKLRRILTLLLVIIVIQSVFTRSGQPLFEIAGVDLITDLGLKRGLGYLFRVMIIFLSGAMISTSSTRDVLQGLNQMHIPYDLALMVSLGIRFLPLLMQEIRNNYLALQLKGIDLKSLRLKTRLELIAYMFMPTIVGTLAKSDQLTHSIEARGYRVNEHRSSFRTLTLKQSDWVLMGTGAAVFIVIVTGFAIQGGLS